MPVRLFTFLGAGMDGDQIVAKLLQANVELMPGSKTADRTGRAIATIDDDGGASYTFDVSWELHGLAGLHPPRWIHIGSIPTFLEGGHPAAVVEGRVSRPRKK